MANFTEREIKRSFIKLLNEKPLSKISVRDIVEDCGINRNSFYYHFQDIPALLEEIVSEQSAAIIQKYPQPDSLEECFRAAFEFALFTQTPGFSPIRTRPVIFITDGTDEPAHAQRHVRRARHAVA